MTSAIRPHFLEQAYERDLEDLLLNRQNLIILADVVEKGNWPKTRREAYNGATELLLQEHNPTRLRFGEGVYNAHELHDAAGVICAVRLIADVEESACEKPAAVLISRAIRTVGFPNTERIRAASRRAFRVGHQERTVGYSHMTTAEYLAAAWLAKKVRAGFPIRRVRGDRQSRSQRPAAPIAGTIRIRLTFSNPVGAAPPAPSINDVAAPAIRE